MRPAMAVYYTAGGKRLAGRLPAECDAKWNAGVLPVARPQRLAERTRGAATG
jgi:hypothetical protein